MSASFLSLNRFHVLVILTWQFMIMFATQMLFGIFATFTPKWRCATNSSQPANDLFGKDCSIYEGCPAEQIQFEPSPFASAAIEFEWICGSGAYSKALYSQMQFIGVLLGTLILAPLSDSFGRKPIGLSTFAVGLFSLALSSLSPNWQWLLLGRFAVSFLMGGSLVVVATFTMEIMPPEHRMVLRTFCNWGISRLLLTFLCFLFPDWRSVSIACALASAPGLLIIAFLLPESPIWLHSQNRIDQMHRSEQRIARLSGREHVPVERTAIGEKASFCSLVRDRTLFSRLLVLWMMCAEFTSSMSSYSVDLNSANISGDLFLNQWLLSIPVIISKIMLLILDTYMPSFSRRTLHHCSQLIVVLSFIVLTTLSVSRYDDLPWTVLVLNQLATVFVQFTWDACYLSGTELMPTPVRSMGVGSCQLVAQLGALIAPAGVWILLVNLFGVIFLEFTWDANVLSAVELMPTLLRSSAVGSCSCIARVGGFFAPLLVFLNEVWGASTYLAVALLGSANLFVSWMWLVDTKGVNLDIVKLADDGNRQSSGEKKRSRTKSAAGEAELQQFLTAT